MCAPVNPGTGTRMDWSKIEDIIGAETDSTETPLAYFSRNVDGYMNGKDILWMPSTNELIMVRILIAAHIGLQGQKSGESH